VLPRALLDFLARKGALSKAELHAWLSAETVRLKWLGGHAGGEREGVDQRSTSPHAS
jgi:hypothetical protein